MKEHKIEANLDTNKSDRLQSDSPTKTAARKAPKLIISQNKILMHSSSNPSEIINQKIALILSLKTKQSTVAEIKHSKTHQNLENYLLSGSINPKSNDSKASKDQDNLFAAKKTTEQIIPVNIAELAKIKEETDSLSEKSESCSDPSPKFSLEIKDTWGKNTPRLDDT